MERTDSMRLPAFPPIVLALVAQAVALAVVAGIAFVAVQYSTIMPRISVLMWGIGLLAVGLGSRWGLPRWWWPLQLLFAPALYWGLQLAIPPWVYLAAFVLCVLVLGNSAGERVPLYLSNRNVWQAVATLLPQTGVLRFVDLGPWLGGGVRGLAPRYPEARFIGVENSPLLWLISRVRLRHRRNSEIQLRSIWDFSLAECDAVYAFLSPAPMTRLWEKARNEMRPGTVFISNSFAVPGVDPHECIQLDDRRCSQLFVWRM